MFIFFLTNNNNLLKRCPTNVKAKLRRKGMLVIASSLSSHHKYYALAILFNLGGIHFIE